MINYNLAGDALFHCLKVSGAEVLLADEDVTCMNRIKEQEERIRNNLHMKLLILSKGLKSSIGKYPATVPDDSLRRGIQDDFPFCLLYTSGTTGLPKACPFTMHRLLFTSATRQFKEKKGGNGDRWYNCMPLYHGTGCVSLFGCLLNGVSVAIGKRFSVRNFWKDICDSESTHLIYVGETARYLLAAPPSHLERSHKVHCAFGNGMRPDVWEKFRERFQIPNITEFFNSTEGIFGLLNKDRGLYLAACVGHHGALMRFLTRNLYVPVAIDPLSGDIFRDPVTGFATRVPYNVGGEILVALPDEQAFQGYWKNPESTEKKFARNVFKEGDLYFRTGDALRRDDDGHWYFLDRLGDTFRWKSENVSTAEVAAVLGKYPGVLEANVYGVLVPSHDGRAGCVALLIDPQHRPRFDFTSFARYARERLPKYAVPVFLRVVEQSNHIHNHKQNKVPLRDEGIDPAKVGTKVESGANDKFLWLPPFGQGYTEFNAKDWDNLVNSVVKL